MYKVLEVGKYNLFLNDHFAERLQFLLVLKHLFSAARDNFFSMLYIYIYIYMYIEVAIVPAGFSVRDIGKAELRV